MSDEKNEMVSLKGSEFDEMVTPKEVGEPEELFMFRCTGKDCGNVHFRHAGYIETLLPYVKADKQKKVEKSSYQVHVCTKCRQCYIWYDSQMYDVSKLIDLQAWEKAEEELHHATGPGGEC